MTAIGWLSDFGGSEARRGCFPNQRNHARCERRTLTEAAGIGRTKLVITGEGSRFDWGDGDIGLDFGPTLPSPHPTLPKQGFAGDTRVTSGTRAEHYGRRDWEGMGSHSAEIPGGGDSTWHSPATVSYCPPRKPSN